MGELITQLSEFDASLPIEFLTYGCGSSFHLPFTGNLLSVQKHDKTREKILQVQADWN